MGGRGILGWVRCEHDVRHDMEMIHEYDGILQAGPGIRQAGQKHARPQDGFELGEVVRWCKTIGLSKRKHDRRGY